MSNPRVKRPFAGAASDPSQRQITSFFGARPGAAADEPVSASEAPLRGPHLPAQIQSNLLSVGMRIRKSVPEGYKTNAPSAFKLWTDETPLKTPGQSAPSGGVPSKELLPFCGINKVGGLDTQADVRSDADNSLPSLDDVPGLSMSQESYDSVASEYLNARKRGLVEDDEEVADPVRPWIASGDGSVSPRSLAPKNWPNARPMAVPRGRGGKKTAAPVAGQENAGGNDFDEAEFLVGDAEMSS